MGLWDISTKGENVPVTDKKTIPTENFRRNWKTFLPYGLMLLAFGLLLYYYREVHECFFQGWHFFSNKERVNNFVISFGSYAPLVFIGLQILQVLLAPIPGEFTGFVGGYLFGIVPGLIYSTVGLSLGSLFAFLIARRLGMPFVRRFMGRSSWGNSSTRRASWSLFYIYSLPHPRHPQRLFVLPIGFEPHARIYLSGDLLRRPNPGNAAFDNARQFRPF